MEATMINCPNCGAPIVAAKCEYCGTRFPGFEPVKPNDIYESYTGMVESGALTVNEARRLFDLDPIKDWAQPFSPLDAYGQGEIVSFHGELHRSLISNNVWSPKYGNVWEPVKFVQIINKGARV